MPNYSHGTKLTLAAADEPPYLTVGTDVSAKYKGAFCEAKIIDVNKHVKLRVLFDGTTAALLIDDTELKSGSTLELGAKIEAKHPEKKQQTYLAATITKILDHSRYTVVFDDGDQCILRRNSICLKSGKHFAESETLDQLPLTNPEHFGNPVKVGHHATEQPNNNQQNSNQQQNSNHLSKQSTNLSSSTTANNNTKNGSSTVNANNSVPTNGRAQTNNHSNSTSIKQENDKSNKTSTKTSNSSTYAGTPGRRGGTKGRKRRESTSQSTKSATNEVEDDPGDSSRDSIGEDPSNSNVNYDLIEVGVKLMVQYGKGKIQNVYEAKVNKIETNSAGRTRYYVHYTGWNNRYDEWVTKNRIVSIVTERENVSRDGRTKHSENVTTNTTSSSSNIVPTATTISITSNSTTKESNSVKEKEDTAIASNSTKIHRKTRIVDSLANSKAPIAPTAISVSATTATPTVSSISTSTGTTTAVCTPAKERDKNKDRDKDREPPSKTRRSRQIVDSAANSIATSSSASSTSSLASSNAISTVVFKEEVKEKESVKATPVTPSAKSGRPRQSESNSANSTTPSTITKDKEQPTKTRRSKHVENSSSINHQLASAPSTQAPSSPPKSNSSTNHNESGEKTKPDLEKEAQLHVKEERSLKQHQANEITTPNVSSRPNNRSSSPVTREKGIEKDLSSSIQPTKTRGSRQSESSSNTSTTVASSLVSTPTSSSASSTTSSSTILTIATSNNASISNTTTASSTTAVSPASPVKEREKDKERNEKEPPPTKIRRLRQAASETSTTTITTTASVATITTSSTTTSTTTASTCTSNIGSAHASNPSSTASSKSSSSSSSSMTSNNVMSSYSVINREKFADLPIVDEPDCDKRISILQDKIMSIKQTYMSLRAELNDLDRKRKRPRLERSNSDHINFSGVTCRN